jgi:hypothetical protein
MGKTFKPALFALLLWLIVFSIAAGVEAPSSIYIQQHTSGSMVIKVQSWGIEDAMSVVFFQIMVYSDKGLLAMRSEGPTDGVIKSFTGDLDQDGEIEIYVMTQSSGSGGYGRLYIYELKDNQLKTIDIEKLSSENERGYRGHDFYNVNHNFLIRAFPVYKDNDPNSLPTGGTKNIFYKLKDNFFVIEKVAISQ